MAVREVDINRVLSPQHRSRFLVLGSRFVFMFGSDSALAVRTQNVEPEGSNSER
jgi:hypothetical protein